MPLQVYKKRFRSMRDLIAIGDARADIDWLVQGDRRLTFGEHNAEARKVAVALHELGVRPGDRVAVLTANTVEWVVMFWACAGMGVACVPLNAWWKAEELDFALRDSGAKVLFCDPKRWAIVRDIVEDIDTLEHVFVMELDEPDGVAKPALDLLAPADPGALLDVPVDEDDILAILYTSGTTGKPKGATITHRQALANLMNLALGAGGRAAMGRGEQRTEHQAAALLIVPLFHVTGTCSTMIVAYAVGLEARAHAAGQVRRRPRDGHHRAREGELDRRRAHGDVAHRRGRQLRRLRPQLGHAHRVRRRAGRARAGRADQGRVPAGAQLAVDGVRAHRVGVGRDRDLGRRLLRAPGLGGQAGADRRGDGDRRRRQRRSRRTPPASSRCGGRRS